MSEERTERRAWARRVAVASGLTVVLALIGVTADHVVELARSGEDRRTVAALEDAVHRDPAVAEALHAERERQTAASVARRDRGRVFGWVLLIAGGLFVGAGRWYGSFDGEPQPELERLRDERFPPAAPRRRSAPTGAAPDPSDEAFLDALIAEHGRHREAAIPILQAIQQRFRYLPDEVLRRVCERTEITPAQIDGTSSFYARFRRSPVGRQVVRVCHGTACHVAGAGRITDDLRRHLRIAEGEDTDPAREFTLDAVACLGCCSLAPVMTVEDETLGRLTPATARRALDERRGNA